MAPTSPQCCPSEGRQSSGPRPPHGLERGPGAVPTALLRADRGRRAPGAPSKVSPSPHISSKPVAPQPPSSYFAQRLPSYSPHTVPPAHAASGFHI